jgi:hypothetical protein
METAGALLRATAASQLIRIDPHLCSLGEKSLQILRHGLDAAAEGFADGVAHREIEPAVDFGVGLYALAAHFIQGPDPDVIFFLAAPPVFFEADDVMADLMQEDREADGSFGLGGFNPVDHAAVVVVDAPGFAAHAATPAFDADIVPGFHHFYNSRKIRHDAPRMVMRRVP